MIQCPTRMLGLAIIESRVTMPDGHPAIKFCRSELAIFRKRLKVLESRKLKFSPSIENPDKSSGGTSSSDGFPFGGKEKPSAH
jgi:hypothetical protein